MIKKTFFWIYTWVWRIYNLLFGFEYNNIVMFYIEDVLYRGTISGKLRNGVYRVAYLLPSGYKYQIVNFKDLYPSNVIFHR